jgi:hypothetical protein
MPVGWVAAQDRENYTPQCWNFPEGLLVLAAVGAGDWLAILAQPDADVGPLLYDLRHHRPALAALL